MLATPEAVNAAPSTAATNDPAEVEKGRPALGLAPPITDACGELAGEVAPEARTSSPVGLIDLTAKLYSSELRISLRLAGTVSLRSRQMELTTCRREARI